MNKGIKVIFTNLVFTLMILIGLVSRVQAEPISKDEDIVTSVEIEPGIGSGLKHVQIDGLEMNAFEISKIEDSYQFVRPYDVVTFIRKEGDLAENRSLLDLKVLRQGKLIELVEVPRHLLSEWFIRTGFRISLVSIVFTLSTGIQYSQLVITPQPVSHLVALVSAITISGIFAFVEWKTPWFISYVQKVSSPVKLSIEKIVNLAQNKESQQRLSTFLDEIRRFSKTTSVNVALIGVLKILFYSFSAIESSSNLNSISAVLKEGFSTDLLLAGLFDSFGPSQLLDTLLKAFQAMLISYPSNQVLMNYFEKWKANAGDNIEKQQVAMNRIASFFAASFAVRASLMSALVFAEKLDLPHLQFSATTGLGALFGLSLFKWGFDINSKLKQNDRGLICSKSLGSN